MRSDLHRSAYVERKPSAQLTPEYEDFGLFKSDVLPVEVNLTPIVYRNGRHDLVVRGFAQKAQKFEVTFAGRRSAMAGALISNLEALKLSFVKQLKKTDDGPIDLEAVRIPILVEGAWRRRHWVDDTGWQQHVNQLVAARWSVKADDGRVMTFGVSPSHIARQALPVMGDWRSGQSGHIQEAPRGN